MPVLALAAPFAALVMDARTGEVLYETNADTRLHPASLTKMMTLYIAFEAIERGEISLDTMVTVSKKAAAQAPSKLGLRPGQRIALRYLIRAAAIKSANDAAMAIGEAIGGSEAGFAKRMNRTAKAIGMTRTTFRNPNGLTAEGHLSTARDMTVLGRRLFYDFPQYYNIFSRRTADAGVAQVASTNRRFLDSYEGADGIKTGYTGPAGFNLTASAQRGNKRIIATILGGKSTANRNMKMAELLDIGFGKAPNKADVQKPDAPVYMADAGPDAPGDAAGDDPVAAAVAGDVTIIEGGTDRNVAAGKTIRLQVAVTKSRRPVARPAAAGTSGAEMVAAAEPSPDAVPSGMPSEDGVEAGGTDAAMSDSIAAVLAEVHEEAQAPAFDQSTAPQPETMAMTDPAEPEAADPAIAAQVAEAGIEIASAADLSAVPGAAPGAEPGAGPSDIAGQQALALASGPADATGPVLSGGAVVVSAASALALFTPRARPGTPVPAPPAVAADALATEDAFGIASAGAGIADTGTETDLAPSLAEPVVAGAAETPAIASAGQPAIQPRADQIVLAEAATSGDAPEQLEVVTRVSTSGGRQWAINVGHFGSRYDAERELLQVALSEMSTLDEALRKVVNRKGGFEANFVGLTEERAELACRRLAARSAECRVIGPQG